MDRQAKITEQITGIAVNRTNIVKQSAEKAGTYYDTAARYAMIKTGSSNKTENSGKKLAYPAVNPVIAHNLVFLFSFHVAGYANIFANKIKKAAEMAATFKLIDYLSSFSIVPVARSAVYITTITKKAVEMAAKFNLIVYKIEIVITLAAKSAVYITTISKKTAEMAAKFKLFHKKLGAILVYAAKSAVYITSITKKAAEMAAGFNFFHNSFDTFLVCAARSAVYITVQTNKKQTITGINNKINV
ncbi:MAG: hypothetical protein LBJ17_03250 [Dysgonamonadaceae bacterium]|jgi:hypothetical protein|nr:hypothetical protein [Dysgonamonadaceae bacterium]